MKSRGKCKIGLRICIKVGPHDRARTLDIAQHDFLPRSPGCFGSRGKDHDGVLLSVIDEVLGRGHNIVQPSTTEVADSYFSSFELLCGQAQHGAVEIACACVHKHQHSAMISALVE